MKVSVMQVGPIGTNCYFLQDEESGLMAIIDPGDDWERILQQVKKAEGEVKYILLTHGHYDHTGAVAALREQWPDIPVYLSRLDQAGDNPYLRELFPPVAGAADYGEGDTIAVGTLTVEVLATPGHSEGSVTLRCGDALFCGDTLFAGSCGRTDFPGGSMKKMLSSLRRLGRLTGDLAVYPGHMEPSTLERERMYNPYLQQAMQME